MPRRYPEVLDTPPRLPDSPPPYPRHPQRPDPAPLLHVIIVALTPVIFPTAVPLVVVVETGGDQSAVSNMHTAPAAGSREQAQPPRRPGPGPRARGLPPRREYALGGGQGGRRAGRDGAEAPEQRRRAVGAVEARRGGARLRARDEGEEVGHRRGGVRVECRLGSRVVGVRDFPAVPVQI